MTDEPRVTHCGKQIMLDGHHLADAVSPEAAEVIAICVNYARPDDIDCVEDAVTVAEFLA